VETEVLEGLQDDDAWALKIATKTLAASRSVCSYELQLPKGARNCDESEKRVPRVPNDSGAVGVSL
jgi:hypothetical protein